MPPTAEPTVQAPAAAPAAPPAAATNDKGNFNDAFAEIDKMFVEEPAPPKPPEKPKAPEVKKPDAAKPAEEKKEEHKEDKADGDDKPMGRAADLRKAYDALKVKHSEMERLYKEIKDTPKDDPEKKALLERFTALEKKYADAETELRFTRYEKTSEYQEKYEKPITSAFQSAYADVKELTIDDGSEAPRKATEEDFLALLNLPLVKAATQAKEWFGDAATEILAHRRKIIDMNNSRKEAVDNFRKQGSEREKQMLAQKATQKEMMKKLWDNENEAFTKSSPRHYAKDDSEPEGNSYLEKGMQLVQLAYDENSGLPPEKMVQLHARVRNYAAAFPREVWRNKQLTSKIEALETELKQYRESEPATERGGRKEEKKGMSADEELDSIAKER